MKKYTFYLFDIDRTLWNFDANAERALLFLFNEYDFGRRLGIPDFETFFENYETINLKLWKMYEEGKITKEILRSKRFQEPIIHFAERSGKILDFGADATSRHQNLMKFGEEVGSAYLKRMTFERELEPGAEQVLKKLKDNGCKIAVVSNGFKEVQYRKLQNSGIIGYIDAFMISEEVGVHKPSPVIFRKAIEALCGAENYANEEQRREIKRESLMVGDDFTNDIEGAQIFGIDQFYYNPKGKPCDGGPTYEGKSLLQIIEW